MKNYLESFQNLKKNCRYLYVYCITIWMIFARAHNGKTMYSIVCTHMLNLYNYIYNCIFEIREMISEFITLIINKILNFIFPDIEQRVFFILCSCLLFKFLTWLNVPPETLLGISCLRISKAYRRYVHGVPNSMMIESISRTIKV